MAATKAANAATGTGLVEAGHRGTPAPGGGGGASGTTAGGGGGGVVAGAGGWWALPLAAVAAQNTNPKPKIKPKPNPSPNPNPEPTPTPTTDPNQVAAQNTRDLCFLHGHAPADTNPI